METKGRYRIEKEAEQKIHTRADWEMAVVGIIMVVGLFISLFITL